MDWLEGLVKHLADLGAWGPVLFIVLYILAAVTLAPAFLLPFSAGAVFGLWRGTLLTYVGAVLGASAVYGLAAPLARSRVLRWIDRDPRVAATQRALPPATPGRCRLRSRPADWWSRERPARRRRLPGRPPAPATASPHRRRR